MPPAWRVRGRLPRQEPLIRAEIKERELRGPEDGLRHVGTTNGLNMSAVLMHLHVIPGQGDGLMFQLERAFIDPQVDWLMRQPTFTVKPPVLKSGVAMPVQVAGVARGKENPVEHRFRIHGALVPGEDLGRTVTAILPL